MNASNPGNGNGAPGQGAAANEKNAGQSYSPSATTAQGPYEDRRNSAACFKNEDKTEPWHADFKGVVTLEGFQDGDRAFVNVTKRVDRKGREYFTVILKKMERRAR
jgi:hypothetical protein